MVASCVECPFPICVNASFCLLLNVSKSKYFNRFRVTLHHFVGMKNKMANLLSRWKQTLGDQKHNNIRVGGMVKQEESEKSHYEKNTMDPQQSFWCHNHEIKK